MKPYGVHMKWRVNAGINRKIILILSFSLSIFSCTPNSDVNEPVELLWDKLGEKTNSLIIFLPGLYDTAEIFKEEQFFTIARKAGIKADMVAASIHIDHLLQEMMVERIEVDILKQAKKAGYNNIWLVGVSLGGLNSLLFYRKHHKEICGVVVLAPYLADKDLTKELKLAGGIKNWHPKSVIDKEVINQQLQFLWVWLKEQDNKNTLSQIYIGYGDKDKYAEANEFLVARLDKKNVTVISGAHEWKTGQILWQKQLSSRTETGMLKPCNKN